MKTNLALSITFLLVFCGNLIPQTADDLNEGSTISHDSVNDVYFLKWWGLSGRTYFIQTSNDLVNWTYFHEIDSGQDAVLEYGMTTSGNKIFGKLQYTDQATADPATDDFDGDGISNWNEITMVPIQGNPLDASDSDGDFIPSDWERFYGMDPDDVSDGALDADGDKVSNYTEFLYGTNPNSNVSADGDSLPDDWEMVYGLDLQPEDYVEGYDPDDDDLSNLAEWNQNSNPVDWDTDDDNWSDGNEVIMATSLLDDTSIPSPEIQIIRGKNQSGLVGTTLQDPFIVSVTSSSGIALRRAPVSFSTNSGSLQVWEQDLEDPLDEGDLTDKGTQATIYTNDLGYIGETINPVFLKLPGTESTVSLQVSSGLSNPLEFSAYAKLLEDVPIEAPLFVALDGNTLSWSNQTSLNFNYVVEKRSASGDWVTEATVLTTVTQLSVSDSSGVYRVRGENPGSKNSNSTEILESPFVEINLGEGIPISVNNSGRVVIEKELPDTSKEFSVWDMGNSSVLPLASGTVKIVDVYDLNNKGEIIGLCQGSGGSIDNITIWDSSLSPSQTPVPFDHMYGMDDKGQILRQVTIPADIQNDFLGGEQLIHGGSIVATRTFHVYEPVIRGNTVWPHKPPTGSGRYAGHSHSTDESPALSLAKGSFTLKANKILDISDTGKTLSYNSSQNLILPDNGNVKIGDETFYETVDNPGEFRIQSTEKGITRVFVPEILYESIPDDDISGFSPYSLPTGFTLTDVSDNGLVVGHRLDGLGGIDGILLFKVDMTVDNNRDGKIEFYNPSDETSEDEPYAFWINNDYDSSEGDDPNGSAPNYSDSIINGIRDLEDFSRLHIDVSSILEMLKEDKIDIVLKFEEFTGSPALKIWKAKDFDGGEGYLESTSIAEDHLNLGEPGVITHSTPYTIAQQYWTDLDNSSEKAYLLFEGAGVGKGKLTLEIQKDGQVLADGPSIWLDLKDIQNMYERAEATPSSLNDPYTELSSGDPQVPSIGWQARTDGFPFQEAWDEDLENKNYIIFVHGWRMSYSGTRTYAENFYKRLWHRGYKGRFAFFRWHTYSSDLFDANNMIANSIEAWLSKYNESEYRAWKYGEGLKQFVQSLPIEYDKHVAAHSMGNVVMCSAIDKGLEVANYAMLQAAIPATCLDGSTSLYQSPVSGALGATYWDDNTPDDHPNSVVRGMSYKNQVPDSNTRIINCYLPNDVATKDAWEANNAIFKPFQHGVVYTDYYVYDENESIPSEVLKIVRVPPSSIQKLREVSDKHENMALLNQSRTKSVGAEAQTGGIVSASVDLSSFGFADVHSAEFIWEIQQLKSFYNMVLTEFDILDTIKP